MRERSGHRRRLGAAAPAVIAALSFLVAACSTVATTSGGPNDGDPTSATTGGTGTAIDPAESVVRIVAIACGTGIEAIATGVAVDPERIATVAHTFDATAEILIEIGPDRVAAEVAYLDRDRDLALVTVDGEASEPLPHLDLGPVADGASVALLSAADGEVVAKDATVVRHLELTMDGVGARAGLELDAEVDRGDSGAPLVTEDGRVAGLVFASDRGRPRGWAIAASEIDDALDRAQGAPISLDCRARP